MKKNLFTLFLTLTPVSAFAAELTPLFSIYGGIGQWSTEVSGNLGDSNTSVSDLGLSDEDNVYFYAGFEHPVPLLPNVRLESISISTSGDGNLTGSDAFQFGGENFDADVATEVDLDFLDFVLYYEILMVDLGITARQFDVKVSAIGTVDGETRNPTEEVDGVLPMLYAQAKFDLPLTGVYVTGNLQTISYDDKSVTDYRAAVGYDIELVAADIGLEIGYRAFEIDLGDEDDFAGDLEFSGVYFGANVAF